MYGRVLDGACNLRLVSMVTVDATAASTAAAAVSARGRHYGPWPQGRAAGLAVGVGVVKGNKEGIRIWDLTWAGLGLGWPGPGVVIRIHSVVKTQEEGGGGGGRGPRGP